MIPLNKREEKILKLLRGSHALSARAISSRLDVSLPTIKRDIKELATTGFVLSTGKGRLAGYVLTKLGELFTSLDAHAFCSLDPDKRNADQYGL